MATFSATLHYWLVDHPTLSQYEWKPHHSPGSSPLFLALTVAAYLALTVAAYLALTLLLRRSPFTLPPAVLRPITALHSLTLCLLSLAMAVGCTLSALHQSPPHLPTWPICFPLGRTPPRGPTFFWAHVFYFSKILEFADTLLILLSPSRARRLSFLHVYHHATVLVMSYTWVATSQSMAPVGIVTNSAVHVVMYAYYMLCAVGVRPVWKRVVTDLQIVQFVFAYLVSGCMLYRHFSGSGCEGIRGWCFSAAFNGSLLALFMDFHLKNYKGKRGSADQDVIKGNKAS